MLFTHTPTLQYTQFLYHCGFWIFKNSTCYKLSLSFFWVSNCHTFGYLGSLEPSPQSYRCPSILSCIFAVEHNEMFQAHLPALESAISPRISSLLRVKSDFKVLTNNLKNFFNTIQAKEKHIYRQYLPGSVQSLPIMQLSLFADVHTGDCYIWPSRFIANVCRCWDFVETGHQ